MSDAQTPSAFLYQELKRYAGISNREAAALLLSDQPIYGGRSPRDRVMERTFLSREVVHVQPYDVNPAIYGNLAQGAQTIAARTVRRFGGGIGGVQQTLGRYTGEAAREMARLLDTYGRSGQIYLNTVGRVLQARLRREDDRVTLVMLAFVATGCLADPRAAARLVDDFTNRQLAAPLTTMETHVGQRTLTAEVAPGKEFPILGLVRVIDGAVRPPIHTLSTGAQGTVVGSIPVEGSCITDVEVDVSRQHLVVWTQEGRWWCQGLESTNGTVLISGTTKELLTVEKPRSTRGREKSQPVELQAGDTLCLGRTTRFLVMRMRG